jgi:predicted 2-oxoglutarate/Fe(II)-dependent dioxygenase YbiX
MVRVNRKAARFHDAGMIDSFEVKSFLSPAECAALRAELRQAAGSQVSAPESYGGGALVLHGPWSGPDLRAPLTPAPGTLTCFPAETTHEVLPITHRERFTIVSWYW